MEDLDLEKVFFDMLMNMPEDRKDTPLSSFELARIFHRSGVESRVDIFKLIVIFCDLGLLEEDHTEQLMESGEVWCNYYYMVNWASVSTMETPNNAWWI